MPTVTKRKQARKESGLVKIKKQNRNLRLALATEEHTARWLLACGLVGLTVGIRPQAKVPEEKTAKATRIVKKNQRKGGFSSSLMTRRRWPAMLLGSRDEIQKTALKTPLHDILKSYLI